MNEQRHTGRTIRRRPRWNTDRWCGGAIAALLLIAGALGHAGCESHSASRAPGAAPTPASARARSGLTLEAGRLGPRTVLPATGNEPELWVIATPPSDSRDISRDDAWTRQVMTDLLAGYADRRLVDPLTLDIDTPPIDPCGGIIGVAPPVREGERPRFVHVPLEHTDVRASISAVVASVDVKQQYHNPYDGKIEAVYVFPLPQDAAVTEFLMTIGERTIRGIIRERQEAERIYEQARRQGYVASLMTQERPNIFTQKVANIEPGKRIDVAIRYFHALTYDDGWYEFHFPMVVGPRFNPPGSGDPVNALPRGTSPSRRGTDVTYLTPTERSGHDIAIACEIDAGVSIEEVRCNSHVVEVRHQDSARTLVTLSPRDSIPNRDFVLRYRVAGERVKTAFLTQRDPSRYDGAGHFIMVIHPPAELTHLRRQPIEMVFVLDCSGSMSGRPIAIAKAAAERALKQLRPEDTFQIIRFSDRASSLGRSPIAATDANVRQGIDYLRSLNSEGGTMMIEGIRAALDFPHAEDGRARYVVFLTDGYIGNEADILGEIQKRIGPNAPTHRSGPSQAGSDDRLPRRAVARIFSMGIGSSVNRYLLDQMAAVGDGVSAFIGLADGAEQVMDRFIARVAHPALENVRIDFGSLRVASSDLYPSRVPDVFAGRPVVISGRFEGEDVATVTVRGEANGRVISIPIEVNVRDAESSHEAIASIWARTRLTHLANELAAADERSSRAGDLRGEMLSVALEYGLMSAYTAFVAVDSSRVTEGSHGTTVQVPVPVPDGVRYDTTVGQ